MSSSASSRSDDLSQSIDNHNDDDDATMDIVSSQPAIARASNDRSASASKKSASKSAGRVMPDSLGEFYDDRSKTAAEARKQYIDALNYTTGKKLVGLSGNWYHNPKHVDKRFHFRHTKSFVSAVGYGMNQVLFGGLIDTQMIQILQTTAKSRWLPKLHVQKKGKQTVYSTRWYNVGKESRVSASKLPKTIKNDHVITGFTKSSGISKPFLRRAMSIHSRPAGPAFKNPTKSSFVEKNKDKKKTNKK